MLNTNEIISQLKSLRENSHHEIEVPGDIWDKDCEALDYAVQAVIEKRERRWIPVSERLPEDDPKIKFHEETNFKFCSVLVSGVYKGSNGIVTGLANRIYQKKTGIEYIDKDIEEGWHWSVPMKEVTAWQSLPEPWEGE